MSRNSLGRTCACRPIRWPCLPRKCTRFWRTQSRRSRAFSLEAQRWCLAPWFATTVGSFRPDPRCGPIGILSISILRSSSRETKLREFSAFFRSFSSSFWNERKRMRMSEMFAEESIEEEFQSLERRFRSAIASGTQSSFAWKKLLDQVKGSFKTLKRSHESIFPSEASLFVPGEPKRTIKLSWWISVFAAHFSSKSPESEKVSSRGLSSKNFSSRHFPLISKVVVSHVKAFPTRAIAEVFCERFKHLTKASLKGNRDRNNKTHEICDNVPARHPSLTIFLSREKGEKVGQAPVWRVGRRSK